MYEFVDEKLNKEDGAKPVAGLAEGIVDGVVEEEAGALEHRHTSDLSMDLHGKSHPDALYRAAGGDEGTNQLGQVLYGCPCCGRTVGRVIRVRATKKSAWMAVCAMCAASTLDKHPEALIGGLVRARRRRRGGGGGQRFRDAG